jgi:hypothetical protein
LVPEVKNRDAILPQLGDDFLYLRRIPSEDLGRPARGDVERPYHGVLHQTLESGTAADLGDSIVDIFGDHEPAVNDRDFAKTE